MEQRDDDFESEEFPIFEQGNGFRTWHVHRRLLITWESRALWRHNVEENGFEPNWFFGWELHQDFFYLRFFGFEVSWLRR